MHSLSQVDRGPLALAPPARPPAARTRAAVREATRFPLELDDRRRCEALLLFAGLDLADFQLAIATMHQPGPWGDVAALATVACRRAKASRTYAVRRDRLDWLMELWDDVQTGVFEHAPLRP